MSQTDIYMAESECQDFIQFNKPRESHIFKQRGEKVIKCEDGPLLIK